MAADAAGIAELIGPTISGVDPKGNHACGMACRANLRGLGGGRWACRGTLARSDIKDL
jgi:hypothetical protein